MQYETAHEVMDEAKVEVIAESMRENGWQGTPVVVWDNLQITGVHRAAAAELAGIEIETIDLADVFVEDGADYDDAVAAYLDYPSSDPHTGIAYAMLPFLSDAIKATYGIDLG